MKIYRVNGKRAKAEAVTFLLLCVCVTYIDLKVGSCFYLNLLHLFSSLPCKSWKNR